MGGAGGVRPSSIHASHEHAHAHVGKYADIDEDTHEMYTWYAYIY